MTSRSGGLTKYELFDSILQVLCLSCVCVRPCPTCPSGLAYCRHLSTVRTHLSALVNHNIVPPDRPCEASGGLSKEVWSKYQKDCKVGAAQQRTSTSASEQQELHQHSQSLNLPSDTASSPHLHSSEVRSCKSQRIAKSSLGAGIDPAIDRDYFVLCRSYLQSCLMK